MMALSRCLSSLALFFGCAVGARVPVKRGDKAPRALGACGFRTEPVERDVGGGYRSFVWTEPYRADLFADGLLLDDAAWRSYHNWLQRTVPSSWSVDPFDQTALLRRQRDIFGRHGYSTRAWDVILNGSVGGLYAANCIESALMAKQNEHHPLTASPTEYGAYILLDGANRTVKVYLQTGPSASVPAMSWAYQSIDRDLSSGFQVLTFLHQHPFFAHRFSSQGQDIAGTAIPSSADLRAFASGRQRFRVQNAWITNGHDSFRFPLSELGIFDEGAVLAEVQRPEFYFGERPEHLEQA